ncbi:MAG TPA: F0F1 ATP synthase subunit delta [Streptosporangiaceae bacterium]
MRGVSRASLAEARERLDTALDGADAATLGDELFAVLHLLDREHGLRRALSDPAQPGELKAAAAGDLLRSSLGGPTLDLVQDMVRLRWARSADLTDAVETLAVTALVASAERARRLDDLEDELFRFGRVIASQPDLRRALSNPAAPADAKVRLLSDLLDGKVTDATLRLVAENATHPRGRSLERGLELYGRIAAERRERLIAVVRTSVELTETQKTRLTAALAAQYGRDIHLNIQVDPTVLGGLSVQIGDEEIDGTIQRRLGDARRRLTR